MAAARPDREAPSSARGVPGRIAAWWRSLPLAATFACYLAAYLVGSTCLSNLIVRAVELDGPYAVLVTTEGSAVPLELYSGPYLYDAARGELVPASELSVPGDWSLTLFVGLADGSGRRGQAAYATMDDVRSGRVELFDWGLNYTDELPMDELLAQPDVSADDLAEYDASQRARRADAEASLDEGLAAALDEGALTSNVAYYAAPTDPTDPVSRLRLFVARAAPWAIFCGLGWAMFRAFYRRHIACPLGELEAAAERIGGGDLDFSVPVARGRELGRLSRTMEEMRASLLAAERELWRTAEERRRLNAAFAHDLRTPVFVLKGTVEMARLRLARGDQPLDATGLAALEGQVDRLEDFVGAMRGLGRLEDRPLAREELPLADAARELLCRAVETVRALGSDVRLACDATELSGAGEHVVAVDAPLAGEVLDNLLSNACRHARGHVWLRLGLEEGGGGTVLLVEVQDDGPGFSPEALRRGCEPFFGEGKAAGHLGMGLSIASTLARLHGGEVRLENVAGEKDPGAGLGSDAPGSAPGVPPAGGARVTVLLDVTPEGGGEDVR